MSGPPRGMPVHLEGEALRRAGYAVVDWIVDYRARLEQFPVLSDVSPGSIREQLPSRAPERNEPVEAWLADLERLILPGITHWQSPNFFAYFPSNASGASLLGEMLSAGLGVQGMLWSTSPACTEVEERVLDWLLELLGLPAAWGSAGPGGGVIQDTASSAVLCALIAARERATGGRANREGVDGSLVVYASSETHSSIEKAVRIAGLGSAALRHVAIDSQRAMSPEALAAAIAADRSSGRQPCAVVATVGTTSTAACDPVAAIADVCAREGLWLHVDAAYAGSAAVCPELRPRFRGSERADSWSFNPHKWLLTHFDASVLWVADRRALIDALSILPEYLRNAASASGAVTDYRDWQIPLGRRFRALKLWAVLRWYGREGLQAHIRQHVELAQRFAAWVEADPDFELVAPVDFALVCFRHLGGEVVNAAILERCNRSGALFFTHTRLDGELVLRLAVGSIGTEYRHVEAAWRLIQAAAVEAAGG